MNDYKPTSRFIAQNEKGQYVYSDFLTEGGYVITKGDYNKFRVYTFRYMIGILVGILLSTFIENWIPCVIAGGATAVVGEFIFRFKFLRNCLYLPRYIRPKKPLLDELTAGTTTGKRIVKMFLFLAFGILIVVFAYTEKFEGFKFYTCWVIGAGSLLMFLLYIISFIKNGGKK